MVRPGETVDAEAASRCATEIARDLGFEPGAPSVREGRMEDPDGSQQRVWVTGIPMRGFTFQVAIADDGEVRDARGVAPGGADPIGRRQRLAALETRCRP